VTSVSGATLQRHLPEDSRLTEETEPTLPLGRRLAAQGVQTVALDNLGYGLTRVAPGTVPTH
jgi:hypothetical protein